jgi:hypothetical protein
VALCKAINYPDRHRSHSTTSKFPTDQHRTIQLHTGAVVKNQQATYLLSIKTMALNTLRRLLRKNSRTTLFLCSLLLWVGALSHTIDVQPGQVSCFFEDLHVDDKVRIGQSSHPVKRSFFFFDNEEDVV